MKVWQINGFRIEIRLWRTPQWRPAAWEGRFIMPDGRESVGYEDTLSSLRSGLHLFTKPETVARMIALPRY